MEFLPNDPGGLSSHRMPEPQTGVAHLTHNGDGPNDPGGLSLYRMDGSEERSSVLEPPIIIQNLTLKHNSHHSVLALAK